MSLKPQPPAPIDDAIAAWGARHLAAASPYRLVGDTLFAQFHDADFADLYHPEGKPGLSPVLLTFVTIFQHLEKLPDRAAVTALVTRLDWKYALHRPLDDAGFDASVLVEFRHRLLDHAAEARCFTAILTQFQTLGLLKTRGRQRTDSTHVLGAIRALHRLETVGETLRVALNDLATTAPAWLATQLSADALARYTTPFQQWHLPQSEAARTTLATQIGQDGGQILRACWDASAPPELRDLSAIRLLRQVWVQQYTYDGETVGWRSSDNLPPAALAINSPHDAAARYSNKRGTIWVGYKVHLSETCDDDAPRLITNVELTPAPQADTTMTQTIHQHLAAADHLPAQHLVDAGYVDAEHLVTSERAYGVDLFGPTAVAPSWQAREHTGYDAAAFHIDWIARRATCPQGKVSRRWRSQQDGNGIPIVHITFAADDCQDCAVRARCTTGTRTSRQLGIREEAAFVALQAARARQQTPEFKEQYALRARIEGSLSQAVRRCDLRHARYWGLAKTRLQALFTAVALNLTRGSAFLAGVQPVTRPGSPLAPLIAPAAA